MLVCRLWAPIRHAVPRNGRSLFARPIIFPATTPSTGIERLRWTAVQPKDPIGNSDVGDLFALVSDLAWLKHQRDAQFGYFRCGATPWVR
jgi:hypothetical protein